MSLHLVPLTGAPLALESPGAWRLLAARALGHASRMLAGAADRLATAHAPAPPADAQVEVHRVWTRDGPACAVYVDGRLAAVLKGVDRL